VILLLAAISAPLWAQTPPPFLGEKITVEVTFLNIPVVTAQLEVTEAMTQDEEPIYHLAVVAKSTPFYSLLYPVNNRYDSYFTWPEAHTRRYSRCINEPGVNLQLTIQYQDGLAISDGSPPRPVSLEVRDLFAALYALRGQALEDGQTFDSPLELDGDRWAAQANVLGREEVKTRLGTQQAVKVLVRFHILDHQEDKKRESDVLTNNLVREKTKLTLWFSDDHRRVPLKASYRMSPFSLKAVLTAQE
jgi:hypothetical protein